MWDVQNHLPQRREAGLSMSMVRAECPAVTVLMRVYNGARYIREAIDSILVQGFSDFELLVVDDGSTDATPAILAQYVDDRRVRVICQRNQGVTLAARCGLQEARGAYVAIMDADDRSHPDRLEKEVAFLASHPEHVLVGSAMRIIGHDGRLIGYRMYPLHDAAIRKATMLYNPFGHSTICFRRAEALACGGYRVDFGGAEDFDFNVRLRMLGKGANLREALVDYRIHNEAFKAENLRTQLGDTIRLRARMHRCYRYSYGVLPRVADLLQRLLLLLPARVVKGLFEVAFYRRALR